MSHPHVLLDSSVVVKWFRNESDSDLALAIQSNLLNGTESVGIAELTLFEVANALRYSGELDGDEVRDCLYSLLALGLTVYDFDFDVLEEAVGYSFSKGFSIYDGYLVALAKAHSLTFVTADDRLLARAESDPRIVHLKKWTS